MPGNNGIDTRLDIDPSEGAHSATEHTVVASKSKDTTFAKLSRELEDEDLNTPGARKLILHRLDELEEHRAELSGYREQFVSTDKEYAVLKERYRLLKVDVGIKNLMSIVGSASLGFLPTLYSRQWGALALSIVFIVSVALIIAPYISLWSSKSEENKS